MNLKLISAVLICAWAVSCSTTLNLKNAGSNEQLKAENSLAKKRLTLLQRENAVFKDENLQHKKEIEDSRARIEKLNADIESLKNKYQKDISLRDSQYQNLMQKNAIQEKESSRKILELTQLNQKIETDMGNSIKLLHEENSKLKETFNRDRENMRNESTKKEFALLKEMEELKKFIAARDAEITSIKTAQKELSIKLEDASKELRVKDDAIKKLDGEIKDLKEKIKPAEEKTNK